MGSFSFCLRDAIHLDTTVAMNAASRYWLFPPVTCVSVVLFACLVVVPVGQVSAQGKIREGKVGEDAVCRDVEIDVRTLRGKRARKSSASQAQVAKVAPVAAAHSSRRKLSLDRRLKDLKPKLEKLVDYDTFELLAAKKETVPIASKRTISLSDGHKLTLRPLYVENQRVGMWMKWNDGKGMEVLDTRMHFGCDESVLTGMEENTEQGLILAIRVSPVIPQ